MAENIHPIFNSILGTPDKEQLLKQKAIVLWMVGLSGSGKSTLARAIENELHNLGHYTMLLDGDNLRTGVNNNLGFSSNALATRINDCDLPSGQRTITESIVVLPIPIVCA